MLSQERFRNNLFLLGDQTVNLFLDCSQRELLTLCSHRPCELTDFPGPNPARPTLLPLLGLKLGLSSHKRTRGHVLNLGIPLGSSEALPTNHTDAPTGPTKKSVGRAPGRLSLNTGHVILIGNQVETTWIKILSEPVQCIQSHEVRAPL